MKIKYPVMILITIVVMVLGVMVGSVTVSADDTIRVIFGTIFHQSIGDIPSQISQIIWNIRLPRVLTSALIGAALALSGAAMQGLLKNPLADGSTLGVSSGASLGAVLAIAFSTSNSVISKIGISAMSIVFAFISMLIILGLAHAIDHSMSTNTIILIGVIFSMFTSSITSFVITIASNKVKSIVFWSMGSLSATSYQEVGCLAIMLLFATMILLFYASELNAFAIGEENARHIGVNVKRTKMVIMVVVSIIIGICVSISGTIGFVGLIIPHIARIITGPNHKRLLPMSVFLGATFLVLADLISRTIVSPVELPIGVITSFIGSILFIYLYYQLHKRN